MSKMRELLLTHYKMDLLLQGMDSCKNFEHLLENTLQQCIIQPMHFFLYSSLHESLEQNGSMGQMKTAIENALNKSPEELGIRVSWSILCTCTIVINASTCIWLYIVHTLYMYINPCIQYIVYTVKWEFSFVFNSHMYNYKHLCMYCIENTSCSNSISLSRYSMGWLFSHSSLVSVFCCS